MERRLYPPLKPVLLPIVESCAAVAVTVGLALWVRPHVSLSNLAFLFLLPVIYLAGRRGLPSGLLSAGLATLAFNFVFIPPAFTFHVAAVDDFVTLVVLTGMALLVSQMAARLKQQAARAEALAQANADMAALTEALSTCADTDTIARIVTEHLAQATGCTVDLLSEADLENPSPMDEAAAQWAMAHAQAAGRGTDVMGGADATYVSVEGSPTPMVARFWRAGTGVPLSRDDLATAHLTLARGAVQMHRVTVAAKAQHDAMREAVLASIGHDLRTPMTSVLAGLDALPPDADGALQSVRQEAARLETMLAHMLDLARMRADALPKARAAVDLTDALDAAMAATKGRLEGHRVTLDLLHDLPLVRSNETMLHSILVNILDNAAKYSAPSGRIAIECAANGEGIMLSISDEGRGLSASPPRRDAQEPVAGSGLGLTVVAGFAEALGIVFTASNRADGRRGACMALHFPADLCIDAGRDVG